MYSKQIERREYHLGALLLIAMACCQCIPTGSAFRPVKALWDFVQLAGFPALMFLFGSLSRELINTRERLIRYAMGFGELYLIQKLLIYWITAAIGKTPSFNLLSASAAPWFFLVLAEYLLLMLAIEERKWKKPVVLLAAVAAGCLAGKISLLGNTLCLARMLVFLPFFLAGRWSDGQQRENLLKRPVVKLAALIGLLAVLAACYWKVDYVYRLTAFFDGNKTYSAVSSGIIGTFGPIVRLGWYALALCLTLGLLALMPNGKLPLLSELSKSWPMAYLWQRPVTLVFSGLLMGVLSDQLGKKGYVVGMLLCAALMIAALLPGAVQPVKKLLRYANFWNPPDPEPGNLTIRKQNGFYARHKLGIQCVLIFTGVFLVLCAAISLPLYENGKSLVWQLDGLHQQYTAMVYLGDYLRTTVSEFLSTGVLRFNQYTFQAGMGMNVLDVIRRDPLLLLCGVVPVSYTEILYNILSLVRMGISGLAFIWLCLELGRTSRGEITCGALSFAFCGYSVYIMMRQPVFQTPCMIYLPLMLTGVERFLKKRKGGLFLVVVCLNFISGYYLAYVNTAMMGLYLLVRLIYLHGKDVKKIITEILKLIGIYFWGMALSGVILLPSLYSYLTCGRTGEQSGTTSLLLYGESYYETLFNELVKGCPSLGKEWAVISFTGLTLLALVLLFLQKEKKFRQLKTGVIICVVMLCMPVFGRIMNGFGYATNRWCYGFELMASLVLVYMMPQFLHLNQKEKRVLLLTGVGYIGLVLCSTGIHAARYVGLTLLAVALLAVLMMEVIADNGHQKKVILSLTMVLTLVVNLNAVFLPNVGNYAAECLEAGTVQDKLTGTAIAAASAIEDDSFYRVEQPAVRSNQGMAMGYYGTTSYFSVTPAGLTETYLDFNLNTATQSFDLHGLSNRAALEALACVKYYCTGKNTAPYGFEKIDSAEGYDIYENQYALPLGYTYTSYMTETDYNALNFAEKQQAILQNAVLPDEAVPEGIGEGEVRLTAQEMDCQVTETENVVLDEDAKTIKVEEANGSITFAFDSLKDSETYFFLEGINYANPKSRSKSTIKIKSDNGSLSAMLRGRQQNYYYDNTGYSFLLGYTEDGISQCTLTFTAAGTYSYEAFRVICLPMKDYAADVTALGQEVMENIVEDGDTITGTITTSDTRLLTFSIPYSKGWTLTVDGQEVPLMKVDKLYMGAVINAGEHALELHYTMPWFYYGLIASGAAVGAIVICGVVVLFLRKRKTVKRKQ